MPTSTRRRGSRRGVVCALADLAEDFVADPGAARYECRLDDGAWETFSSPTNRRACAPATTARGGRGL